VDGKIIFWTSRAARRRRKAAFTPAGTENSGGPRSATARLVALALPAQNVSRPLRLVLHQIQGLQALSL